MVEHTERYRRVVTTGLRLVKQNTLECSRPLATIRFIVTIVMRIRVLIPFRVCAEWAWCAGMQSLSNKTRCIYQALRL